MQFYNLNNMALPHTFFGFTLCIYSTDLVTYHYWWSRHRWRRPWRTRPPSTESWRSSSPSPQPPYPSAPSSTRLSTQCVWARRGIKPWFMKISSHYFMAKYLCTQSFMEVTSLPSFWSRSKYSFLLTLRGTAIRGIINTWNERVMRLWYLVHCLIHAFAFTITDFYSGFLNVGEGVNKMGNSHETREIKSLVLTHSFLYFTLV